MAIEFSCLKIETTFQNDAFNFASQGSCVLQYHENLKMLSLSFKKLKERIYFNDTQSHIEFSHQVL